MTRKQILTYCIAILIVLVGVERAGAQYIIPTNTSIGTWDSVSRTYTLTTDVTEPLLIVENNLTLDGAGHSINAYGDGIEGLVNGITVKNVIVKISGDKFGRSGISLFGSGYTVTGNTVIASDSVDYGIYVVGGDNNIVSNNSVWADEYTFLQYGILVDSSNNAIVRGNTIASSGAYSEIAYAIAAFDADNCTVTDNTISGCFIDALLIHSSYNFLVTGNTISNNARSFNLYFSTGKLYNNNFIGNTSQWGITTGSTCEFYLPAPVGGNYWSNHTSPDDNSDSFVDVPYVQDQLPWVVQDGWLIPEVRIGQVITEVLSLNLQQGISNSLDSKLDAVIKALDDANENNDVAAVNALNAFINAVEAQRGGKIPEAEADTLIEAAQQIIDLLNNR